jgi:hypothetical protein
LNEDYAHTETSGIPEVSAAMTKKRSPRLALGSVAMAMATAICIFAPARAHHSQAAFDTTREITIEGVVHRLDWKNPHIYLIVETKNPDGSTRLQQVEGLAVTQSLVVGLDRAALKAGTHVLVRINPNRNGGGRTVRGLDVVTTANGKVHPFYRQAAAPPALKPARSLAGKWAPSLAETGKVFGAARGSWKLTAAGSAGTLVGACEVEPIPFLTAINELREIQVSANRVLFRFDNSGDDAVREVQLNQKQHPAGIKPSLFGHSIGHWEGQTLVIDTVGYMPHPSGVFTGIPSGVRKHTVERLTLMPDGLQLRYEVTMEDPDYLAAPASFSMLWDHRPDLAFAKVPCDKEVSDRYLAD